MKKKKHHQPRPINESNFTTSTMKLRSDLQERSDKVKALFEPGSADYQVMRTFDSSPEAYQLNSMTLKYQENIRKLWELTR